eukprot:COSAG03_NODE_6196_length_1098_cov_2.393393_2_plen_104_part_00
MLLAGPLIDDAGAQNGGYSHGGAPTTTIRVAAESAAKASGFRLTSMFGTSTGTGSVVAHNTSAIDGAVGGSAQYICDICMQNLYANLYVYAAYILYGAGGGCC